MVVLNFRQCIAVIVFILISIQAIANDTAAVPEASERVVSFYIKAPEDLLAVTHGGQVNIGQYPTGIKSLADSAVQDTLVLLARVRDENDQLIGISSELEYFPKLPVAVGVNWDTYWTVVIPGRGTLYGYHKEGLKKQVFDVFKNASTTKGGWQGKLSKQNTTGPLANGRGQIVGGTGEFANSKGWFVEKAVLSKVTEDGTLHAVLELEFHLQ